MKIPKTQAQRVAVYRALCRKYGRQPEPEGCWSVWPDCLWPLKSGNRVRPAWRHIPGILPGFAPILNF